MNYAFIKNLIGVPYAIAPEMAAAYMPALRGALSGLEIEAHDEPIENRQYMVNAATMLGSYNPEPSEGDRLVAVTPMRGVMLKHDGDCGEKGTRTIAARLLAADAREDVCGHILLIESGGGQTTAVPEMTDAIAKLTKPVVAYIDGMACSAAIWVASACRKVIASHERDRVGCVGVMMEISALPQKAEMDSGEIYLRIYAEGSEEKNGDFEAALQGNIKAIQDSTLNPLAADFKNFMKACRPGIRDEHLKGRTYFASDVVSSFIDNIGTLETAVATVLEIVDQEKGGEEGQGQAQQQKPHITDMKRFQFIAALLAAAAFEVVDGQATLSEAQLQSIEDELARLHGLEETAGQTQTKQQERIDELERLLSEKGNPAAGSAAEVIDEGADGGKKDEDAPAQTVAEAFAAARKHIEMFN